MYTQFQLENGIPLVHREGVHLRHHLVQHLQALSKKQYPYSPNLKGSVLCTKRAAGCPITTGSPSPSQRTGHCKGMPKTVPEACTCVVTAPTEARKAMGLHVGSDCTGYNFLS